MFARFFSRKMLTKQNKFTKFVNKNKKLCLKTYFQSD